MSRGINKVILVGTCGQDPEVRYLPNGNAVTNLSLATSEQWTDKQTGQKVEKTEWHRVVLFGSRKQPPKKRRPSPRGAIKIRRRRRSQHRPETRRMTTSHSWTPIGSVGCLFNPAA